MKSPSESTIEGFAHQPHNFMGTCPRLLSRRVAEVELLGACPDLSFAHSGSRYIGIQMRSTALFVILHSLALAQAHCSTIQWTRSSYSSVAVSNCFQKGLSLQAHRQAPIQTFTLRVVMSGPGAIASLFSSVTVTTVAGNTSISGQMDTVVPSYIISPSDIDKIQIQYARNVSAGIQSVHQVGKVPHAVWLGLEHVAELFGVSGTVAKGSKTSCAAPASRTVTSLGSDTWVPNP